MILRKILRDPVVIVVCFILFGLVAGSFLSPLLAQEASAQEEEERAPSSCQIAGLRMPVFTRELAPAMPIFRAVNRRLSPLKEELMKYMPQRDIPRGCMQVRVPQRLLLTNTFNA